MSRVKDVKWDDRFFTMLERTLPECFTRKKVCELLGGVLEPSTLANLDCGQDSAVGGLVGKKKVYLKSDFIQWLKRVMNYSPNTPPGRSNSTGRMAVQVGSPEPKHENNEI